MVNKMATEVVVITVPSRKTTVPEQLRLGFADVRVYVDECMRGGAKATQDGIRLATGDEHVLLCEDDILVCDDLYGAVKAVEFPPQVGVICYCDMREMPTGTPRGLYPVSALGSDGLGWWGNQCLLIHKEVVLYLQREDWFAPEVCNHPGVLSHAVAYGDSGLNCTDKRMSLLVHKSSRPLYAVHVPSLAIHAGHQSVCFGGRGLGERETRNPGRCSWLEKRCHSGKS
jgi:hypothetical protein